MEIVPVQHKSYIKNLFRTANEDVDNGVVAATKRERVRLFNLWCQWLDTYFPNTNYISKTKIDYNKSKYWLPSEHMLDPEAFHVEKAKLALKRLRWHIGPSPRRYNWTENLIPWQTRKANIQKRLAKFWKATDEQTHQPNHN